MSPLHGTPLRFDTLNTSFEKEAVSRCVVKNSRGKAELAMVKGKKRVERSSWEKKRDVREWKPAKQAALNFTGKMKRRG